jgi:hypothetical protein
VRGVGASRIDIGLGEIRLDRELREQVGTDSPGTRVRPAGARVISAHGATPCARDSVSVNIANAVTVAKNNFGSQMEFFDATGVAARSAADG